MKTIPIEPALRHGERTEEITTIVFHATAGSNLAGAVTTLKQEGLSYNYLIEKDGDVHKACPSLAVAFHAGSSYGPEEQAAGVSRAQYPNTKANRRQERVGKFMAHCSVNGSSIGISFVNENVPGAALTAKQMKAAFELVTELLAAIPSIKWITTHAIVSPGRKTDPVTFDLDAFVKSMVKKGADVKAWRFVR